MNPQHFQVVVVGSGFAGSLIAMIAKRLGRSVVMIERGKHPRFIIGESSTPLANLLLEELTRRYDLPEVATLTRPGSGPSWRNNTATTQTTLFGLLPVPATNQSVTGHANGSTQTTS